MPKVNKSLLLTFSSVDSELSLKKLAEKSYYISLKSFNKGLRLKNFMGVRFAHF